MKVFLSDKNSLSINKPEGEGQYDEYISDPAHPVPYTEDVHFNRTRNT